MKLIELKCPGCGAPMLLDPFRKKAFCEYCATVTAMDDYPLDDAPADIMTDSAASVDPEEAGYLYEKQAMKSGEEAINRAELEQRLRIAREQREEEKLREEALINWAKRKAEDAEREEAALSIEERNKNIERETWIWFIGFVLILAFLALIIAVLAHYILV